MARFSFTYNNMKKQRTAAAVGKCPSSPLSGAADSAKPDPSSVGRPPSGVSLGDGASTVRLSKPDPSSVGRSPSGVSLGEGAVGGSGAEDMYATTSDIICRQAQRTEDASQTEWAILLLPLQGMITKPTNRSTMIPTRKSQFLYTHQESQPAVNLLASRA